jgi:hypothetical protein
MSAERTIYVAGGSSERDYVASVIAALRAAGWTVTCDWTVSSFWAPGCSKPACALADLAGVLTARTFWLILPSAKSEGSHFELGVAIATSLLLTQIQRRETIVSGPRAVHGRIFPDLADRHFDTHEEALCYLTSQPLAEAARTCSCAASSCGCWAREKA